MRIKSIWGEKSHLLRLFAFCAFVWLRLYAFWCFLVLLVRATSFHKKNKKFKTALITSFILLLNSPHRKYRFFQSSQSFSMVTILFNYHSIFQLSQSFSMITIFFNYHNPFQSPQSFSIITILFNHHKPFQLLQSFSIITILFNHRNPFQSSQSFSIITIFFNYHNLFLLLRSSLLQSFLSQSFSISLQLVTLFMKISLRTNFII